jgi:hypothetical protein
VKGGAFGPQPDRSGGALTPPEARSAALELAESLSADSATAPVTVKVMSYDDFRTRVGQPFGKQLPADESVIAVTVHRRVVANSTPRPPGAPAPIWNRVSVAFDARTGLTLWIGPAPIAD